MPAERKRPWYLVVALLGALALGTTGAYAGWNAATLYFVSVDPTTAGEGIADVRDRELVVSRAEAELHVLDTEKARGWPIAVATLLLGGATLFFAMRALGGSSGARTALVQLVLAQAAVGVASHFLLRDVFEADLRWLEAKEAAEAHAAGTTRDAVSLPSAGVMRAASSMVLVMRTLGSLLVVVGLTRNRSRAYFDETAAALEER
jgi:hypothetical protein